MRAAVPPGAAFLLLKKSRRPQDKTMPNRGIDIQQAKARGEWAELRFMARTAEHGLYITKPWGDSAPYDFAVDHNGHFVRVQVKCTLYQRGNSYNSHVAATGLP